MTRNPRSTAASALAVVVVAGLLAGCASPATDLAAGAATQLQADVLAVSRAAAVGDLPVARTELRTLTEHVTAARDGGKLSVERQRLIQATIALVSADLTTLETQTAQAAAANAASAQAAADAARNSKKEPNRNKNNHG